MKKFMISDDNFFISLLYYVIKFNEFAASHYIIEDFDKKLRLRNKTAKAI